MRRTHIPWIVFMLGLGHWACGTNAESAEALLRKLPPGLSLQKSNPVAAGQAKAIGKKLGGDIRRLTNSCVQVHGRPIQVNVITAVDEANAKAILASLLKIKPHPFVVRKGRIVIEYVGRNIDEALATKTSYELGLVKKPAAVRYRVTAELAAVESADYMACTPLLQEFLALGNEPNEQAAQRVKELAKRLKFGQSLILRNPKLGNEAASHRFQPAAKAADKSAATVSYSFANLPKRQDVPYVAAMVETTVDATGLRKTADKPAAALTAATPFWPANDPRIKALAQQITRGKAINGAKAMAILQWLTPGKNIKYEGQTGSRWGTAKVLNQKFGHCWDFSDCFVTLCRAAGVPSRQVAGWLYGSSGHVWAEFYREGKGWHQVDPTGGGALLCGIYHIPYFTTEDGEMPIVYVSMPKIEVLKTQ